MSLFDHALLWHCHAVPLTDSNNDQDDEDDDNFQRFIILAVWIYKDFCLRWGEVDIKVGAFGNEIKADLSDDDDDDDGGDNDNNDDDKGNDDDDYADENGDGYDDGVSDDNGP